LTEIEFAFGRSGTSTNTKFGLVVMELSHRYDGDAVRWSAQPDNGFDELGFRWLFEG